MLARPRVERSPAAHAFLCYNNEATVYSWTKEEDDAVALPRFDVACTRSLSKRAASDLRCA